MVGDVENMETKRFEMGDLRTPRKHWGSDMYIIQYPYQKAPPFSFCFFTNFVYFIFLSYIVENLIALGGMVRIPP